MTHKNVRVEAINVRWPPEDEGRSDPVLLDMVIDEEAQVVGRHLIFGLEGDPAVSTTWCPFVLRENGDVHFGAHAPAADSYYRINLREKKIAVGEQFTSFDQSRKERVFQITKVFEVPPAKPKPE